MNRAYLTTRRKQFEEKMKDPEYVMTSYAKQKRVQNKLKENDTRPRI